MAGKLQVGQCFLLQGSLVRIWLGTVGAVRVGQPLLGTVTIPIRHRANDHVGITVVGENLVGRDTAIRTQEHP